MKKNKSGFSLSGAIFALFGLCCALALGGLFYAAMAYQLAGEGEGDSAAADVRSRAAQTTDAGGLLALAGMPVLAGFAGGPAAVFGPTGGFVAGYILAAWLEGRLMRRAIFSARRLALAILTGTAACYALGLLWFMASSGSALVSALSVCVLPFLPGDLLKILLAVRLCQRLQKPLRAMGFDV